MNQTFAALLCALLLIVTGIQGALTHRRGRCICPGQGSDFVQPQSLEKMEVFPKSSSCDRVEIIATLKSTGEQRCLNPNSPRVKKMLTRIMKKRSAKSTSK
uniref:Chemokine interleukin-8-like domain-containing protein n=1 Tax=Sphenodon punctatus TaxID=8508 RepID=A0A8D0L596_SPHPU